MSCLSDDKSCWSCELYESVFFGMRQIVTASYGYFVGTSSDGSTSTTGAMGLAISVLTIAVLVKVLPIAMGSGGAETGAKLRLFFLRVTIAFGVFLSSAAYQGVQNPTLDGGGGTSSDPGIQLGLQDTNQGDGPPAGATSGGSTTANPASDWFIDGPLALGTQIASDLAGVASKALSSSGGTSGGSGTSLMTGASVTNSSSGGGSSSLATTHVTAAKSMLLNLHKLGVAGIVVGVWMTIQGASQLFSSNPITAFTAGIVGIMIAWLFFMFTITFGLRYIDALIKSMMIFALMPLFVFLWIFDSTRDIAVKALKAGLALAAVFAVSGVVFSVAVFILGLGFSKAFNSGGSGLDTSSLSSALKQVSAGGFSFLAGNSGSASSFNWLSLCYLVGSASLAIACAQMSFDLAASLFSTGQADLGIGKAVGEEITSVADKGKGAVLGAISR